MRVVRAWPQRPPASRPHVVDGWPRVPVDDYDYRALAAACGCPSAGVVSMDWDTACSLEHLQWFARYAALDPAAVLVAPVRTYYGPRPGQWNLATISGQILTGPEDGDRADLFGFGLVYLPWAMITSYLADCPGTKMTDQLFATWHYAHHGPARVCWEVQPVHLHYPAAMTGRLEEERHDATVR